MQSIVRKVYLSVMISVLCMITLVTATFAWVGFFDFSNFEKFEINLNSSELEEYGIEISLTGEDGTFGSSVDEVELKKQILINMGYSGVDLTTKDNINDLFSNVALSQCSVLPNEDKSFPDFVDYNNRVTKKYFKFDIYLSVSRAFESEDTSEYLMNAYLKGELLEGTTETRNLVNEYIYPSDFINNISNGIQPETKIKNNVTVDSSSACRLAIQKYNVVDKYHPEMYNTDSIINDLIIFQGGTSMPTYDSNSGIYSFGGILKNDYNLALCDHNTKFPDDIKSVPEKLFSRGDIEYRPNYQIINSSKTEEKIGVNQMMKLTICFWFEGWDADCFDVIDSKPVTINLILSTKDR